MIDVLDDWLEFKDVKNNRFVNLQRKEIEAVIQHNDNMTELIMKSGSIFYVDEKYEKIMEKL